MVQEIYRNSMAFLITPKQIPVKSILIENSAKHLIKSGHRLFVSAKKEFEFGEVAEKLAEVQTEISQSAHLKEIAGWHFECALASLETAAENFKRAENCTLSAKYRKYAAIRRKKCLQTVKEFQCRNTSDSAFYFQNLLRIITNLFS